MTCGRRERVLYFFLKEDIEKRLEVWMSCVTLWMTECRRSVVDVEIIEMDKNCQINSSVFLNDTHRKRRGRERVYSDWSTRIYLIPARLRNAPKNSRESNECVNTSWKYNSAFEPINYLVMGWGVHHFEKYISMSFAMMIECQYAATAARYIYSQYSARGIIDKRRSWNGWN